ncbi:MAG: FAD-binding oxidoreductase [Burkholderiaceae bacterium]
MTAIEWPPSLWAAVTPPGPSTPPPDGDLDIDTVVIGGGFTGLSTALHLALQGVQVVVLEAVAPGWGASGRNNGQVIPTLTRPDPQDIIARHGEAGERFVALLRDSADYLFELVRGQGLAAEAEQHGWVQPVHTPGRMKIARRRVEQWSAQGAPVELLSAAQITEKTGSTIWHGGFWNPQGGHVNPLALSRELARAVIRAGGRVHGQTPATRWQRDGAHWVVATPHGRVRARRLMLATNAYTGEAVRSLAPDLAREVVPVLSWQMATRPLDERQLKQVIPGRQAVSDTHGDLWFMRLDARQRLVTGGALIVRTAGAARLRRRVGARLARIFPALRDIGFDHVWNGYIGMTTDFMPRLHRLGPDAYGWVGCNGRGVALAVALGREFAQALQGTAPESLALPLTDPVPLPAHALLRRLAPWRLMQYRLADGREI